MLEHNGEIRGDELRGTEKRIDLLRFATDFQLAVIEFFIRIAQDRLVGAEILDKFDESVAFEESPTCISRSKAVLTSVRVQCAHYTEVAPSGAPSNSSRDLVHERCLSELPDLAVSGLRKE